MANLLIESWGRELKPAHAHIIDFLYRYNSGERRPTLEQISGFFMTRDKEFGKAIETEKVTRARFREATQRALHELAPRMPGSTARRRSSIDPRLLAEATSRNLHELLLEPWINVLKDKRIIKWDSANQTFFLSEGAMNDVPDFLAHPPVASALRERRIVG